MMTYNGFNAFLAQQQVMQPNPAGQQMKSMILMAVVCIVLWVMMFAPQRKKAKQQESMLKSLKAGDKVVTASGILGVVLSIKDKSVSIRSADTKLEILKSAVAEVTDRGGDSGENKS